MMKDKAKILRRNGTFNFASGKVTSELFSGNEFFDHEDLMQVKYEMLRSVVIEHCSIARSCAQFGLSRMAFYRAQREFSEAGLSGMLPEKRGPKGPHKLKGEFLLFLEELSKQHPDKNAPELLKLTEGQIGVSVHPRTISRALKKLGQKKGLNGKVKKT